jgi:hypothetical protein
LSCDFVPDGATDTCEAGSSAVASLTGTIVFDSGASVSQKRSSAGCSTSFASASVLFPEAKTTNKIPTVNRRVSMLTHSGLLIGSPGMSNGKPYTKIY